MESNWMTPMSIMKCVSKISSCMQEIAVGSGVPEVGTNGAAVGGQA